ncbi:MAG: 3-oxoacyl-[acyl-carrier-protein] reductase [Veillonella sp.]|nr:3-oxoacyl-[acyl-carrier-protein] reductase [Veillonella sp.]
MHLEGKVALVTGASRGIGRAVAIQLAQSGADVAVNYSGSEAAAQETVDAILALGRKAIKIKANVANAEEVAAMVEETHKTFGHIDILVNNAGITRDGLLMRMKDEDFDAVIDINLKGVYLVTKAVSKIMMKQRAGHIINMTSVVGLMGNAGQANYAASKAGVIGFTKSCAKELASRGITVNAIAPGFINTDMTDVLPEKVKEAMVTQIPLGRMAKAEEVAAVTTFDKVKAIVVEQLGVDEAEVTIDSTFIDDLGADSLDIVELIMAFEEEFNVEIPDDVAEKIKTVKDTVEYIDSAK